MVWRIDDPEGNESGKIVWETVPYTRGQGLDLGCGANKVWPHAIGVDNYAATQQFGQAMRPDVVSDCTRLQVFGSASMDWVYSSHLLEHIQDTAGALKEWWRVIKPGGYLVLYLPHKDFYPNVGTEGANPDHKHDFHPQDIVDLMKDVGSWDLVRNEDRNEDREYSFFQVYKKRTDGKRLYSHKEPLPEKRAAVLRYGAFGDAIQASSILPGLKAQGYHITFYCTPRTQDVLRHDPHIDAWYVQDVDQVPNLKLGEFWGWECKKFDRFINLSESVEGTLLTLPGRPNHVWPANMRRKHLDVNYFEFVHDLADVPMPPKPKFYATDEEKAWAKKEAARLGGPLVMYSLSGSSVHKVWPWQDRLFARILLQHKEAQIVTVGDELSQMLEVGWEQEPRVHCMSGKYTIRQSMSLLAECAVVIGPETGMLNAAAHMDVPKIVLLSHSSANNLTKHWVNTVAVEPQNTACYPCHKMHYSFEHCNRSEETGTALCATNTDLEHVWNAFAGFMKHG
jgi:ADP-heptose:LPS heptosyltransferase/predicted SAM-dependent methyltransferase